MRFYFRKSVTIACLLLAALMIRASFWQWDRHQQKLEYIEELEERLEIPVGSLEKELKSTKDWQSFVHRRLQVSGEFDFSHEMVVRNRRYDEMPGVHLITPLKIKGLDKYILVNRGFVPLKFAAKHDRAGFQRKTEASFVGLIKEAQTRKFLAPRDGATGESLPWVDSWLRVDISSMQEQLPYDVLPFYIEQMQDTNSQLAKERIVSSQAGKEEIFMLQPRNISMGEGFSEKIYEEYPVADFSTVIPAGRHLGYVYEWGIMALATILIGLLLQFRPPRQALNLQ